MAIPRTHSAGGIVLGDNGTIALVWSNNSKTWLFPKGQVEEGETNEEAGRREIAEETGLDDLEYLGNLGFFERIHAMENGKPSLIKQIHMFLYAAAPHAELAPTMEIKSAQWVPFRHVMDVLGTGANKNWFEADRAWFASVSERVKEAIQRD